MEEQLAWQDIKSVARRRYKGFTAIFLLVFAAMTAVAFIMPSVFRSQTTIVIEEQQIPREYIQATVTSYVEERLKIITQQVLSRTKLLEIINRFNLYEKMKDQYTTDEIVENMRLDIDLKTISAEVASKRGGGGKKDSTIAFVVSYEGNDPTTVQRVANVLASLYLEENVKARESHAANTTEFLEKELENLKFEINGLEQKISEFKTAHMGELPENTGVNMQAIDRLNRDLDQISAQIRSQQERIIYLQGQLATVDQYTTISVEDGKTAANPNERLNQLRLQLAALQAKLSDKHPDVKKVMNEIKELETQIYGYSEDPDKTRRINELKIKLAALKSKYGPKHPDVIRVTNDLAALSAQAAVKPRPIQAGPRIRTMDNPAYINLKTQLASAEMEMKSLSAEREGVREKITEYQRKLEKTPLVEKEYNNLIRDYETAKGRYRDINIKLMQAKAAQGMEEERKAEHFTIIEPAQLPETPVKPNRPGLILVGFILALGAGAGFAFLREALDHSVKTQGELLSLTGLPILSTVRFIETFEEIKARKRKRLVFVCSALFTVALALVIIHLFVMPLDLLLVKLQKKVMMRI
ncbi:MAG: GNVR domain-containing protein [Thermodesulfobacteriota bacterium]